MGQILCKLPRGRECMNSNSETSSPLVAGEPPNRPETDEPLAVDLDGTLVVTDLFVESIITLIKQNPLYVFAVLVWLFRGRARTKREVCRRVVLDVGALPYRPDFLAHLRQQRALGRRLVLTTANDERIALQVANHLQIFDAVFASNGQINLAGRHKRDRLVAEFGEKAFDYAGDSRRDLAVWASAREAIVIDSTGRLSRAAASIVKVGRVFRTHEKRAKSFLRALRPYQWSKNVLVFVPLVLAHRFVELNLLAGACLAFLAFGLCASAVYLMNDLTDLQADRHHPRKCKRPFASGDLPVAWGLGASPLLLGLGLAASFLLPLPFLVMLVIYFALNLTYSFCLKKIVLLDVIVLAGLYTMRVMAGSAAVGIWPSPWLLGFSTFMSLSLAMVKRYAELVVMSRIDGDNARVRGYEVIDKELLASLGSGSGYLAVLVLAMYISSGEAEVHYSRHQLIWLMCPLLLYWISYFWLMAHRGRMHDDPLVFSAKDPVSRTLILLMGVVLAAAV
jgi:4-hydroxybenzoate polyprenyltransferase